MGIILKAKLYAHAKHNAVNQKYDGLPYSFHTDMVARFGKRFEQLLPKETKYLDCTEFDEIPALVISACYLHDILEDCHNVSYNDLSTMFGKFVAEIVFNVTDNKGRTRAERSNLTEIAKCPYATFVKICDRLANTLYSGMTGSTMFEKYQQEFQTFYETLNLYPEYEPMWDIMQDLVYNKVFIF